MTKEYPLGAGLGRWGMMNTYFGRSHRGTQLRAEIQIQGWLLDGGIPLCAIWCIAIGTAILWSYRIAVTSSHAQLGKLAMIVFCLNLFATGQCFAGPTFNAQAGILFWFLNGMLYSCSRHAAASHAGLASQRD
jgi:hypothetical protein